MNIDPSSLPDHLQQPHVRPIHPIPLKKDGKQLIALRDPAMLSRQNMLVPPQVIPLLRQFDGNHHITEISKNLSISQDQLIGLIQGLEKIGLLWGPTFEAIEAETRTQIAQRGAFLTPACASLGESEESFRDFLGDYFDQTEDPELDSACLGIVAPHLDFQRGWPNYATAYHPLRDVEPPDRVVILGTNHFGLGDGMTLTEFGFETPMGICPCDTEVVSRLTDELGDTLLIDQLDHLAEHSIQLQIPWIQYCFGNVPIVAALVPDPMVPMIKDDGQRVELNPFTQALSTVLNDVQGSTFYVASSDLSHVGPQFGEPLAVDDQRKFDVERHDRDMLGKFIDGDAESFLGAMQWSKNPTRWCSVGNMTALLQIRPSSTLEMLDYRQACDEQGQAMVTSAAIALTA